MIVADIARRIGVGAEIGDRESNAGTAAKHHRTRHRECRQIFCGVDADGRRADERLIADRCMRRVVDQRDRGDSVQPQGAGGLARGRRCAKEQIDGRRIDGNRGGGAERGAGRYASDGVAVGLDQVDRATERRTARGTGNPSERADIAGGVDRLCRRRRQNLQIVGKGLRRIAAAGQVAVQRHRPAAGVGRRRHQCRIGGNPGGCIVVDREASDCPGKTNRVTGVRRGAGVARHDIAADSQRAVEMAEHLAETVPLQPGVGDRQIAGRGDTHIRSVDENAVSDVGIRVVREGPPRHRDGDRDRLSGERVGGDGARRCIAAHALVDHVADHGNVAACVDGRCPAARILRNRGRRIFTAGGQGQRRRGLQAEVSRKQRRHLLCHDAERHCRLDRADQAGRTHDHGCLGRILDAVGCRLDHHVSRHPVARTGAERRPQRRGRRRVDVADRESSADPAGGVEGAERDRRRGRCKTVVVDGYQRQALVGAAGSTGAETRSALDAGGCVDIDLRIGDGRDRDRARRGGDGGHV